MNPELKEALADLRPHQELLDRYQKILNSTWQRQSLMLGSGDDVVVISTTTAEGQKIYSVIQDFARKQWREVMRRQDRCIRLGALPEQTRYT